MSDKKKSLFKKDKTDDKGGLRTGNKNSGVIPEKRNAPQKKEMKIDGNAYLNKPPEGNSIFNWFRDNGDIKPSNKSPEEFEKELRATQKKEKRHTSTIIRLNERRE